MGVDLKLFCLYMAIEYFIYKRYPQNLKIEKIMKSTLSTKFN